MHDVTSQDRRVYTWSKRGRRSLRSSSSPGRTFSKHSSTHVRNSCLSNMPSWTQTSKHELTLITVSRGSQHKNWTASRDVQSLVLENDQIGRFQSASWPETWTWRASRCIPTASWLCPRRQEWRAGESYSPDWETACRTLPPSEAAPTGTLW